MQGARHAARAPGAHLVYVEPALSAGTWLVPSWHKSPAVTYGNAWSLFVHMRLQSRCDPGPLPCSRCTRQGIECVRRPLHSGPAHYETSCDEAEEPTAPDDEDADSLFTGCCSHESAQPDAADTCDDVLHEY